jgi:hypothetical protein
MENTNTNTKNKDKNKEYVPTKWYKSRTFTTIATGFIGFTAGAAFGFVVELVGSKKK